MSRSGYTDYGDCYDAGDMLRMYAWNANVRRCIGGKAGQRFMWELFLALEALPEHELYTGALEVHGGYCALGAVAISRKIEIPAEFRGEDVDEYEFMEAMGPLFGIKDVLAREVMYQNDDADDLHETGKMIQPRYGQPYPEYRRVDTPAERWQRMRAWVASHLNGIP